MDGEKILSWIAPIKDFLLLLVALISVGTLGAAIYKAWKGEIKSASTLATIFVVAAFISSTPLIETFKAVGVEVTLRKSLDRADDILTQIRKESAASGASTYMLTAWAGRFGEMSRDEKQKLLDSVNAQMKAAGVPDSEIATIVKPHIQRIAFEIYSIFYNSVAQASGVLRAKEPQNTGVVDFDAAMYKSMTGNAIEMVYDHAGTGGTFSAWMKGQVASSPLPKEDIAKLNILADRLGDTFEGCRKAQGYTRDSLELLRYYTTIQESGHQGDYYKALKNLN